ncbi:MULTISPECIES: hypothetical protein [Segatella]|uniref:Uncharacterized protein n=2 Tax=Segatella TaxID=2974251 RepID=D8DV32_9BACT|nr:MULTISPECIES: hypothetical protein [Segatella]EFI72686.1 hypothetical protein PBR_0186 [Segatella baroniae B14]UKK79404.1 hypothetical protein L6469_13670 [Segatella baroniae B14]GJG28272.1 hypothetical protein PRRU23_19720 [Segatella bryantii]SEQ76947.1 hypothetical protein SAMN05444375_11429 [Segatella baroniae B14]
MGKIRIYSKQPKPIVSLSETYTVFSSYKSGKATLRLNPDGEYLFTVYGDIGEATAKRSSTHIATEQKLTNNMLKMYEEAQDAYTAIHKKSKLRLASSYSVQQNVKPQGSYQWKTMDLKKPTDNEAKELVVNEARNLNHNPKSSSVSESDFLKANIEKVKRQRMDAWDEIQKLFNLIEQAQADKANASFKKVYDASVRAQQEIIDGESHIVDDAFYAFPTTLVVPFIIELDYKYNQAAKSIDVSIELTEDPSLKVPIKKATLKKTGKISVRAKTQGDLQQDYANTCLSLMYYVACNVFNISPNIQTCRISLYTAQKANGICWMEFNRNRFSTLHLSSLDLLQDMKGWPNVANLRVLKTTSRLFIIEKTAFENQIKSHIASLT